VIAAILEVEISRVEAREPEADAAASTPVCRPRVRIVPWKDKDPNDIVAVPDRKLPASTDFAMDLRLADLQIATASDATGTLYIWPGVGGRGVGGARRQREPQRRRAQVSRSSRVHRTSIAAALASRSCRARRDEQHGACHGRPTPGRGRASRGDRRAGETCGRVSRPLEETGRPLRVQAG
jgi:hypothetical protein